MSNEESKNDVVKEARELLARARQNGLSEADTTEIALDYIKRSPSIISALCDEVERLHQLVAIQSKESDGDLTTIGKALEENRELRSLNSVQAENIEHMQSQLRVMKEAIRAAIEFADLSQRCPHNCGPNCSAEGKSRMLRAEALSIQLRDSITPKGSD